MINDLLNDQIWIDHSEVVNLRKVKDRKVFWKALDTYITATVNIIVLLKLDKKNFLGDVFVSKSTNTTLLVSCLRTASVCRLRLRKHHILYIKAYVDICRIMSILSIMSIMSIMTCLFCYKDTFDHPQYVPWYKWIIGQNKIQLYL